MLKIFLTLDAAQKYYAILVKEKIPFFNCWFVSNSVACPLELVMQGQLIVD